ncbi:MAG: hypothetical protein ABL963_04480 [Longimicrobiales bacterium]
MRPSALHRLAVALVATTFLFGGAEHWFGLETCPHHDAAFVGHGTSDAEDAGHHAHHGGSSDAPESGGAEHGPCDCIGPCATPSPTALPATASFVAAASFERVEISVSPPRDFVPPQFVPFLLPYAHAPPSLG